MVEGSIRCGVTMAETRLEKADRVAKKLVPWLLLTYVLMTYPLTTHHVHHAPDWSDERLAFTANRNRDPHQIESYKAIALQRNLAIAIAPVSYPVLVIQTELDRIAAHE